MESHKKLLHSAKEAEEQKDFSAASDLYESLLKEYPADKISLIDSCNWHKDCILLFESVCLKFSFQKQTFIGYR